MEAARVLKLRGHEPVIYEKTDRLGGTLIAASAESYKGNMRALLYWYRRQMDLLDIEVHYNSEIKDVKQFGKSDIIIATGARPRVLGSVPGHELMIEATEYLLGKEVGQKVAVVGGGLSGCEIAYELALKGKEPVIIEMKDDIIAQKGVCLANSSYLREWFDLYRVPIYLETSVKEIWEDCIVCTDKDGKEFTIECDSVISSIGYIPDPVVPANERESNMDYVGDCKEVGNLRTVIWRAYEVAMRI
jgi:2-enoate reductase